MPTYNKASLAKKPKAKKGNKTIAGGSDGDGSGGSTKKNPLSKRPVKKVPIKRPSVKKEEVAKKNSVVIEPKAKATKKRPNAVITSEKKPKLSFSGKLSKETPPNELMYSDVTGKPIPKPTRKPVKAKAKKKVTKPKKRGGR